MTKIITFMRQLARWFFGSPFRELPPEFGDPVPPELRRFEDQLSEVQHQPQGKVRPGSFEPKSNGVRPRD